MHATGPFSNVNKETDNNRTVNCEPRISISVGEQSQDPMQLR